MLSDLWLWLWQNFQEVFKRSDHFRSVKIFFDKNVINAVRVKMYVSLLRQKLMNI